MNISGVELLSPSENECDEDCFPDLVTEYQQEEPNEKLSGRRIVNISHMLKQLTALAVHGNKCTTGRFDLVSEERKGLCSFLKFKCLMCEEVRIVSTEEERKEDELNDAFVWGALAIGIGHQQAQEMMALTEVPIMSKRKWNRHEQRIEQVLT